MPGPAIYVAVAIGTVAAVIVFKEFVYDPHFRPRIAAWREDIISRRQRRARPHSHSVSQSSPSPSEGNDGRQVPSQRGTRGKKKQSRRSVESSVTSHIELQHLIASEAESLRSSVEADGDNTGIRLRRVGESQKPREGNSGGILDSNSMQPLISIEGSNVSDEIPSLGLKNRPLKGAAPVSTGIHLQQGDASRSGSTPLPPDVLGPLNSHTPVIEMPHATEIFTMSRPRDFLTPTLSGDSENTRPSSPDTDLLSASDIPSVDQSFTTHDQTLSPRMVHGTISPALSSNLSIELLSSPSFSPPGSPFIDAGIYRELIGSHGGGVFERSEISSGVRSLSPNVVEGTPPGAALLAVRGDSEVFSLSSQVLSDISSDEDDYDYASVLESEGEGVAQH